LQNLKAAVDAKALYQIGSQPPAQSVTRFQQGKGNAILLQLKSRSQARQSTADNQDTTTRAAQLGNSAGEVEGAAAG
jgi:hypothetical protein